MDDSELTKEEQDNMFLFGSARKALASRGLYGEESEYQIELITELIGKTYKYRRNLNRVMCTLVVDAIRENKWLLHKPSEDFPNGYNRFSDYLYDCGITDHTRWELGSFGEMVALMDARGYDTDRYLSSDILPKFQQARYRLIKALEAETVALPAPGRTTQELLDLVENQRTRDDLRKALREPGVTVAKGAVNKLGRRALVVMSVDSDTDIPTLVNRLGSMVDWSLISMTNEEPGFLSVVVNEPFD